MGLKIVCQACSHVLFEGFEPIPFFKLRDGLDGTCPKCKRKLAIRPISSQRYDAKGVNIHGKLPSQIA